MPTPDSNAESKLRKLGERLRQGWQQRFPASPQQLSRVRDTIRDQWQKEQHQKQGKTSPQSERNVNRRPPERDPER